MQNGPDEIHIQVGDETVVIDGDLATEVIQRAVEKYINEALTDMIRRYDSSKDELIEWQEAYYRLKKERDNETD
jgi:hypothetical protein